MRRFQAVLLAARKTQYYKRLLQAASVATAQQILSLDSIDGTLARLPHADSSAALVLPEAFVNSEAPAPARQRLFYPLPRPDRTAILAPGFRPSRGVRIFLAPQRSGLCRYRPDALAGPVAVLRRLAEPAEDLGAPVPRVTHAVIAFSSPRHGFLSDEARRLFWRVFQVPVFGQYLGFDGELLAWECEAHDGLHICPDDAIFELASEGGEPRLLVTSLRSLRFPMLRLNTGLTGRINYSTCACGLAVPRLTGLRRGVRRNFTGEQTLLLASCAAD